MGIRLGPTSSTATLKGGRGMMMTTKGAPGGASMGTGIMSTTASARRAMEVANMDDTVVMGIDSSRRDRYGGQKVRPVRSMDAGLRVMDATSDESEETAQRSRRRVIRS